MSKNETGKFSQQPDIFADKLKVEEVSAALFTGITDNTTKTGLASPETEPIVVANEPAEWIIVVDDSPANLTIICGVLNKLGFGTISYRDGQQALSGLEGLSEERRLKVRAIFSDLMMPNLDGLALLREVRRSEKTAKLPFVMVTSSKERDKIAEAANLKINGYLLKPITATTITDTITHLFPEKNIKMGEGRIQIRRA